MGKNEWESLLKRKNDKKPINPIVVLLAFLLGAATAFAAFWRMWASKGKKGAKASDDAVDRDYEAADREMKQMLGVLRRESERRMWGDPEIRISGDYGVSGTTPANVQPQQVKPYKPRSRVSAKKIFVRVTAMAAAAALVVTGIYMSRYNNDLPASTVLARESFGGIRQVVEDHDEDNPFVILDIVPGKAYATINGNDYDFSLGTIGYLAPGQSPIQQDILRIFTGDAKTRFYDYTDRKALTSSVISSGYNGISYQEAYGGTGENLKASVWSKIYDPVEVEHDGNGILVTTVPYATGRLYARVEKRADAGTGSLSALPGYDYNLTAGTFSGASAASIPLADGIYGFAEGQGNYQVVFEGPSLSTSGYRASVLMSGSFDEVVLGGHYSDATGVYIVENGAYHYVCTIGEFKGIPRPEPKPTPEPDPAPTPTPAPEEPEPVPTPEEPTPEPEPMPEPEPAPTPTPAPEEPDPDPEPAPPEQSDPTPEPPEQSDPTPEPDPAPAPESDSVASAFRTRSVLGSALEMAGTEDGWYLCVGMEPAPEESTSDPAPVPDPDPTPDPAPAQPEEPTPDPAPVPDPDPTPDPAPAQPENPAPEQPAQPEAPTPEQPESPEPTPVPGAAEGSYCILKFTYAETEQEEWLYQEKDRFPVSTEPGDPKPYDSYVLEGMQLSALSAAEDAAVLAADASVEGEFEYVGGGKGMYKLTRMSGMENVASLRGIDPQDVEVQEISTYAAGSGSVHYVEVQNAPVYMRCTGGNDWLRRYVFNSLKSQDNDSDDFALKVDTVFAGDVTYEMVQEADLVYLEEGTGLYLDAGAGKRYIGPGTQGQEGLEDISDTVITRLLYEVVEEAKPIIVDYGIITNEDNYKDTKYQKLAKAFLKKDLLAFYQEMAKSDDLAASVLMNVDKDLKDFPNKKDNDYHYVNRSVYLVNGTPLVADDFSETMDKDAATAGFNEVLAAIRAENVMLSEDEKISEKISKAMAVQYIINYSLGLVGEYKDLSILELQPTANMDSDLHRDANEDKGSVVLYWNREDQDGEGQQILRSSKMIETNVTVSSVAAFNSSYQDINADYNMIFIGLDGQRLYHERNKDGKLIAVYNDEDLNGKVYHTGDSVSGGGARYDANDITELKKEALLDYLRAGYPIVVENECFKERTARKADAGDINTDYIASDTQMYAFLKEALSLGSSDDDDRENGIGLYTIEDVHSSALFAMQLNAQRPKIELRDEDTGENGENASEQEQIPSGMIEAVTVPDAAGFLRGTIEYRLTSDRTGEDKTYMGSLERHLYLDLNYDGIFAPEEEYYEYLYEDMAGGGRVSVDFNEIKFGIVPWKLEVTDTDNKYRRAATQGCFTISGGDRAKIRVLQVLDDPTNDFANLQEQYETIENGMLAYYMKGAEGLLKMNWDIETVTPDVLAGRLAKNANYLSLWDVMVLGFGNSGNPGDAVATAVNDFISAGGSVLVSSAGASMDQGRLGIPAAVLGQTDEQTYGKLGLHSDDKFRYEGILARMFEKTPSLFLDRVNDGTISKWPYQISSRACLGGNTEVSMPDYLLDIGAAMDDGQPYATAWFTLLDLNLSKGAYSVSPRDGKNNYYVYSKGNVVYVGQTEYKYVYDPNSSAAPEGDGVDECRIFVNALLAAYNAGLHKSDVSIVAGFNGVNKVESVTVPYDTAFKETGEVQGGILGETVDVYFRFTDNNIACDKTTALSLYYRNPGAGADTQLLLPDGGVNTADYTPFISPVWMVEDNRLTEVVAEGLVPDKVYRIKAPLIALQGGEDETSQICVLLTNRYTRAGRSVEAVSMDSVSLNRAQMFLLE